METNCKMSEIGWRKSQIIDRYKGKDGVTLEDHRDDADKQRKGRGDSSSTRKFRRNLMLTSIIIFIFSQTRAPNNVAFRVAGTRDAKSNAIAGDLEAKYVDAKNGVTLTQTWTTSNVLKTQVELENQVAKGQYLLLLLI